MRRLKLLLVLLLMIAALPVTSASAYTGGLLNGKPIFYGSSITDTTKSTMLSTNNNGNDGTPIKRSTSLEHTFWAELDNPMTITEVYLRMSAISYSDYSWEFYNSSGILIKSLTAVDSLNKVDIEDIPNVKKVALVSKNKGDVFVFEMDVFGLTPTATPEPTVSPTPSPTPTATPAAPEHTDLLRGIPLLAGRYEATDGNDSTGLSFLNTGVLTYEFPKPVDLTAARWWTAARESKITFYDINNENIGSRALNPPTLTNNTAIAYSGVKKIVVSAAGTDAGYITIYSLELYGESQTTTPTPTATPEPSVSPTPSPTPTATPSATPSPTVTPDPTPTTTPSATPTVTPSPTATATPTATVTPEPTATATSTPVPTATPTPTVTPKPTVTPAPTPTPEQPGDRAILVITMTNGVEKEYDLPIAEVNAFLTWYDAHDAGRGPGMHAIDKHSNNRGPFKKRKDYVVFDKILTYEVSEYTTAE